MDGITHGLSWMESSANTAYWLKKLEEAVSRKSSGNLPDAMLPLYSKLVESKD